MITREQLDSIGFKSKDNTLYYDWGNWDYEYNVKTQELFRHCEMDGATEFLCRCTDVEVLKEIIDYEEEPE